MEARPLKFITEACGGKIVAGDAGRLVQRVCTDSRQVQAGDLFIALAGERFDAHDFLPDVVKKAAAVLVRTGRAPADPQSCAVIEVADLRAALGQIAAAYRRDFAFPFIAVGGSNGKTTTKELIAAVLRQRLATVWSEASFNNDIGVPLTLLRVDASHQAAVLEAGTNHPGELRPLLQMIQPRFGVITNVGREHLEFFGDLAGVAQEEGALAEALPADGTLVLNGDDAFAARLAARSRARVVRVGFGEANDWRAAWARLSKDGATFRVTAPRPEFNGDYRVNLLGRHQVNNALFALALGAELGLTAAELQRGLAECKPAKMRLQLFEQGGVRVLDDAYNANADSVLAALQTLAELPCKGRTVAVLGDMAELGAHTEAAHREVGRRAAELGIGQLIAVGKQARWTAEGARAAGLHRVLEFADVESAAGAVKNFLKPGDLLLLKASRAARLERITEQLRQLEPALKN
ncbi:MAG TPA: UDP-N-acetylmuramoyl-tripeptide--D-alanyl-D-alanine ligase [Verrucomicrobiae bacterium]|nr:UDP-N-acetylmuramoyl-tripeptide--D-alanyl-D-alanine ligase [Verrucomicrobiae bacterium]